MKKGIKTFSGLLVILLIISAGYFLAEKFKILPQKKVEYTKEIVKEEVAQEEKKPEEIVEGDVENIKKDEVIKNEVIKELSDKKEAVVQQETQKKNEDSISNENVGKVVDKLMSSGFKQSSGRKIDTIIIHTSYNAIGNDPYDIDDIIKQYVQYEVSAHYLIGRDGTIYRLVKEKDIAWHAGVSKMPDGRTDINDFSIGIEVVNTKDGKFTDAQYKAINNLISDLKKKYNIENILGHNDIAPGRKTDPWGIEWSKVNR